MPTIKRYLASTKNVGPLFSKIQHGVPPDKFNLDHLKALGFSSSNDRAIVPLLKDLGFLTSDGTPTQVYRDYRDTARSKSVMAQALRQTYPDLFVINEHLSKNDRDAVIGRFKSLHDSSDVVAEAQARTFFALLELADLRSNGDAPLSARIQDEQAPEPNVAQTVRNDAANNSLTIPLTYRFEIQLPPTKDIEVFRAIFRAMREELIDAK